MVGPRWAVRLCVVALAALAGLVVPVLPASAEPVEQEQWHLDALRVKEAHKISTGTGVVVAVVDTGVQADHPDLAGQVLDGTRITGRDDKGKTDVDNHGTGVAGLIVARGGGPEHALGIAPGAKVLPVGVLAKGSFTQLPQAIRWAVDHGARVITISIGERREFPEEAAAVQYAFDHDVVVVASAGNLTTDPSHVSWPAAYPGVIAVSATDRNGDVWSGSTTGPQVVLSAPGVDIVTLLNHQPEGHRGGYLHVPGGTSASAPIVAGVAALVRAKFPQLHAADVVNRLIRTADDAGPPGRDPQYGFGRVDPVRALTADLPTVPANPLVAPSVANSAGAAAADGAPGGRLRPGLLVAAGAVGLGALVLVALVVAVLLARGRRRARTVSSK